MTELKPCPFCPPEESNPALITPEAYMAYVKCLNCGCMSGHVCATEEEAIERWNTRAEREVGISKFQKITGTSYIEAKSILTSLEQAGAKVVE